MADGISICPIGRVHSCFKEKFGIPRQPGLADKASALIEMIPPYNRAELVRDLDQFSHIWVLFQFHDTLREGWKPTVRPPGLGGQQRVGVFASRSPHRPNHIGISVVRLLSISDGESGVVLEVGGVDFLDGTPVIDIKPYIPFSDAKKDAHTGYSARGMAGVEVVLSDDVQLFCEGYQKNTGKDLAGLILQLLRQDPRPASQRGRKKIFWYAALGCEYSVENAGKPL